MTQRPREWLLVALLCALALPPRFYHLGVPPADGQNFRQTLTASIIRNYVERDRNFLHPQLDVLGENRWFYIEFPLYEYLLALPMMAVGYSEALIRLFNIACGMATVLVLYRFLREEGLGEGAAAAGAGLYAATPIAIYFDRALMMDTFVVTLGAVYLLGLRRWIETGSRRPLAWGAAALGVALAQKLPVVWPAAVFGPLLVLWRRGFRAMASPAFLAAHGLAGSLLAAWVVYVRLSGYGLLSMPLATFWQWNFGWGELARWERVRFFFERMANGFSFAWAGLAAAGAVLAWRGRQRPLVALAACGVSAFVAFPNLNIVHTHYQLPILFAAAPAAGLGLWWVVERAPRWKHGVLAGCLLLAMAWGFQVALWSHFPLEQRLLEAARELAAIPQNGAQLFYVEGGYSPTMHYLARRRGLVMQDGAHAHSGIYKDYKEFLVFSSDSHPPGNIAHYMEPWRLKARYRYWQVYARVE